MMKIKMEELFPYEGFPIRLEHPDGKKVGRKNPPIKICYFQHIDDAKKYIKKYKLKKQEYKLDNKYKK